MTQWFAKESFLSWQHKTKAAWNLKRNLLARSVFMCMLWVGQGNCASFGQIFQTSPHPNTSWYTRVITCTVVRHNWSNLRNEVGWIGKLGRSQSSQARLLIVLVLVWMVLQEPGDQIARWTLQTPWVNSEATAISCRPVVFHLHFEWPDPRTERMFRQPLDMFMLKCDDEILLHSEMLTEHACLFQPLACSLWNSIQQHGASPTLWFGTGPTHHAAQAFKRTMSARAAIQTDKKVSPFEVACIDPR